MKRAVLYVGSLASSTTEENLKRFISSRSEKVGIEPPRIYKHSYLPQRIWSGCNRWRHLRCKNNCRRGILCGPRRQIFLARLCLCTALEVKRFWQSCQEWWDTRVCFPCGADCVIVRWPKMTTQSSLTHEQRITRRSVKKLKNFLQTGLRLPPS